MDYKGNTCNGKAYKVKTHTCNECKGSSSQDMQIVARHAVTRHLNARYLMTMHLRAC
jgi:hypothetical protein